MAARADIMALSQALEARAMPHDIVLRYDGAGAEVWSIALDPTRTYLTADLQALATYCTNHALTLSMIVAQLGIA